MGLKMAVSRKSILALPDDDVVDQGILSYEESYSFGDGDIKSLRLIGAFPSGVVFIPFDSLTQPYFVSPTWVCFPEYPFSLGQRYPFAGMISEFFKLTGILYIQAMPFIWMILYWIDQINQLKCMDIVLSELACVYDLTTFGNSQFLIKVKT